MSATFPLADLVVRITADMSQFSREMVRTETLLKKKASAFTALESQGKSVFNVLGKAAGGFGNIMAVSLTAGLGSLAALTGGLMAFSVWAAKVATGADELRNRFKVTFGMEAAAARAEIEKFADDVGRSRLELMDMAATLQNVFTAMGFTVSQSSKLSVTIAKLGTDIASFHDIADSDAVDRLSSALVGNHEALRSLGIVVTETAVKQQLLAMGFKGGFDAATDQEKMLARLAIILQRTSLMQNDATNTANSMSNQFKGLWGVIKDLADAWGVALLPAVKVMIEALTELAFTARNNTASFTQLGATLVAWATSAVEIFSELGFVIANYDLSWQALVMTVQQAIEPILTYITQFAANGFATFDWMTKSIQTLWQNLSQNIVGIMINLSTAVAQITQEMWDYVASYGADSINVMNANLFAGIAQLARGIDPLVLPEIETTDWDAKWRALEDEMNKRREGLKKGGGKGFDPFQAPDLQSLFNQINGTTAKGKIEISMADSVSAWKDNLKEAFKNSDTQKQTALQQQIAANQQKQMDADKANTDTVVKAVNYVGGGFY